MSDYLNDSPILSRAYCPTCEPDADPFKEILETRYCGEHDVRPLGADDQLVQGGYWLNGNGDADPNDCRAIQRLITRRNA